MANTPVRRGRNAGRGPRINADPKLTGPRAPKMLEAPRPMKDITPRTPAVQEPRRALPAPRTAPVGSSAGRVLGMGLRALSGLVGGAVASVITPTSVGNGERQGGEKIMSAASTGRKSFPTGPRSDNNPSSGPSSRPNNRPATKATSTSGVTASSTSSAPSVKQAAATPTPQTKTMAAVSKPKAAAQPKVESKKRNFRPFGENRIGSGK